MLAGRCYFRGDWTRHSRAMTLLREWCRIPGFVPEFWNTVDPINKPFDATDLEEYACHLAPTNEKLLRPGMFLERRSYPRYWGSIDLKRLLPRRPTDPWVASHNWLFIGLEEAMTNGDESSRALLGHWIDTTCADYAYVADLDERDYERFKELTRAYTAEEMKLGIKRAPPIIPGRGKGGKQKYWFTPILEKTYGPHGHLWDIVWYNFFGPPYVDLIGEDRLRPLASPRSTRKPVVSSAL